MALSGRDKRKRAAAKGKGITLKQARRMALRVLADTERRLKAELRDGAA